MLMFISLSVYANDIYVNQSGATLDLDITQDGQNNTVGSSGTASSVIGATTNLAITQVGDSNVMTFDVNGATYTTEAVAVAHDELLPPLSQLKSMLLELPVTENVPV